MKDFGYRFLVANTNFFFSIVTLTLMTNTVCDKLNTDYMQKLNILRWGKGPI